MKKFLSTILALSILSATFAGSVFAQNENVTFTAADVTVNADNTGIVQTDGIAFGTNVGDPTYGNAKVYKETGIYGLSADEYGLEIIAREQRKDQPYIAVDVGDIDASKDFYLTTNVYVGQQRENDHIRLGTVLMDENGNEVKNGQNFQGYKFFMGDGRIKFRTDKTGTSYQNGSYSTQNWVNYTIAGTDGVLAVYVDGVKFEGGWVSGISGGNKTHTFSGILKNVNPGIHLGTVSSELGGIPSFAVLKDVKLVYGTYNPANSSTAISSSKYTVTYNPVELGSDDAALGRVNTAIIGVSSAETVSEFMANITAPAGGNASVIKIADDTKKTSIVAGTEYMSSDMKLLAKSADGSMKIYDIDVSLTGAIYKDTTGYTDSGYTIDDVNKYITLMPHTTVETVKNVIKTSNGATYTVVNAKGQEVTSGAITETMKLVVKMSGTSAEYAFQFKDTTAHDVGSRLASLADGTELFKATGMETSLDYSGKGLYGINHSTSGYNQLENANPKVTPSGNYVVTKTNMPGHTEDNRVNAWFFDAADDNSGWRKHSSNALGLHGKTKAENGKKTVISFNVNLGANSGFSFAPRHAYGTKPDCTDIQYLNTANTGTGDRITFTENIIKLGGQNRDWSLAGYGSNYLENIGTYQNNTEYEVVLIESRGTTTLDGVEYPTVVTEAIYVNGTNIIDGSPRTMVIKDGRDYFALRDVTFQTIGDCYVGNLKIYMADEYSIAPVEDEETGDGEVPEDADLTITTDVAGLEIYTADPVANNMPTVKGYSGTVGDLRAALDSDINTRLEVLERTATSVISDNVELQAGMYVKVTDVNNPENFALYLLSDLINMGEFAATKTENTITATRTIKCYKPENKTVNLIIASYSAEYDKLINVDMDTKTITTAGTYVFEASVDNAANVKIMLWDGDMKPYFDAVSALDLIAN